MDKTRKMSLWLCKEGQRDKINITSFQLQTHTKTATNKLRKFVHAENMMKLMVVGDV